MPRKLPREMIDLGPGTSFSDLKIIFKHTAPPCYSLCLSLGLDQRFSILKWDGHFLYLRIAQMILIGW